MKTIMDDRRIVDPAGLSAREQALVVDILGFLASEPDRLSAFFDITGMSATSLRDRVEEQAFRRGLFDYVVSDDGLVMAFAAFSGRTPEIAAREIAQFRPAGGDD